VSLEKSRELLVKLNYPHESHLLHAVREMVAQGEAKHLHQVIHELVPARWSETNVNQETATQLRPPPVVVDSLARGPGAGDTKRFGKLVHVWGLGLVVEILPMIFLNRDNNDPLGDSTCPIYIRNARVEFVPDEPPVPITNDVFDSAIELLAQGLEVTRDLVPGLNFHKKPVAFSALIAASIHANQFDKLGFPYIEHPRRVFLNSQWSLDPVTMPNHERLAGLQAAWLHDVIEDSPNDFYRAVDANDLENWGFSPRVVFLVQLLTRSKEVSSESYYQLILDDFTARAVKLADVADNLATWRSELLNDEARKKLRSKYDKALVALELDPIRESWFETRVAALEDGFWPLFAIPESAEALALIRDATHEIPVRKIASRGVGVESELSGILRQCEQIVKEASWVGREGTPSPEIALDPFPLDAWFAALFILHATAQENGDPQLRDKAESLADFLDGVSRAEVHFFAHLGWVSRKVNYLQIKLRYPVAIASLQNYLNQLKELEDFSDAELLDMALIAFSDDAVGWASSAKKDLAIAIGNRARG